MPPNAPEFRKSRASPSSLWWVLTFGSHPSTKSTPGIPIASISAIPTPHSYDGCQPSYECVKTQSAIPTSHSYDGCQPSYECVKTQPVIPTSHSYGMTHLAVIRVRVDSDCVSPWKFQREFALPTYPNLGRTKLAKTQETFFSAPNRTKKIDGESPPKPTECPNSSLSFNPA